jgi:hypothetical protein
MKTLFAMFIYFCLFHGQIFAQVSFSVSDTALYIIKKRTNFAVYHISQLNNLKGEDFKLKWVKHIQKPFPDQWTTTVQDPQVFYNNHAIDSAEFTLQAVTGTYDKFISHVLPHSQVGQGTIRFHIFRPDNPKDGVWISFYFTIEDDNVTGIEEDVWAWISILPNKKVKFNENVEVVKAFNLLGEEIFSQYDIKNGEELNFSSIKGVFVLQCFKNGTVFSKKMYFE